MDLIRKSAALLTIFFLTFVSLLVSSSDIGREKVVATFPKHFPPQFFLTPEGEPSGFAIEVINEVAREANIDLEFRPAENWLEANQMIRNGEADVIPNMGITPERAEFVLFTSPYEQFAIRIFVRSDRTDISGLKDLQGKRVGTTKSNVANELAKNVDLVHFNDSTSAVQSLINEELDALLLPDVVVKKLAADFKSVDRLKWVGKPLKVVQRAIAVSNSRPDLHQKLERALVYYTSTSEFTDTQKAWEELPKEKWTILHLIVFNVLFFIVLAASIIGFIHNRFRKKPDELNSSNVALRVFSILLVFSVAILLSMGVSLWVLYDTAFEGQKSRLVNIAQSRAKIIESIVRFDLKKNQALGIDRASSNTESIGQIREAHENFKGFGLTGEFTFASRLGDQISFILRQRHSETVKPKNVAWRSSEAEPMRRALSGRSGTLIGLDYRGVEVLAAHEPVKILNAGIVAKIDLAEIRAPYIKAGLIALGISQCILFIGFLIFSLITAPILNRLSEASLRLKALLDHSPNLIVLRNKKGEIVLSSPMADGVDICYLKEGESDLLHKDGSTHTYLTMGFKLQSPDNIEIGSGQISTDISARVEAETELKQYAMAFESTSEGMIITNTEGVILSVNSAFEKITGYNRSEACGETPSLIKSGRHNAGFYEDLWACLQQTGHWSGEIWNRRKNGEAYPEWLNINSVKNAIGKPAFYVAVFSDITSLKQTQDELYYLAHHDPLTQLPNRLLFKDRLDHALENARRDNEMVAVLAIDLDRFKNVNDSLGHPAGDELLKSVANRLSKLVRENDTVCRIGGDEFTIIAENIGGFHSISGFAEKIVKGMLYDLNLENQTVMTSVSLGIAVYPQDGKTHEALLKNADTALYQAKTLGRNRYQFYTEDLSQSAYKKLILENQIALALHNQEFSVYYQPQFEISTGKLVSAEALVRWNHPQLGILAPDKFIPTAEENGLIVPLGEWVLQKACKQAKQWLDAGYEFERIAVNLAGKQLDRPNLYETVREVLRFSDLPADKLELEITEGFIMDEYRDSVALLESLSQLGISIAIDDFGTGYSSLSYLKRLPVRILKIDRSFVNALPYDEEDAAISRAVIALGHSLGMEIIAEGVETQEQLDYLQAEGCEIIQGFLKGKPVSGDEFEAAFF